MKLIDEADLDFEDMGFIKQKKLYKVTLSKLNLKEDNEYFKKGYYSVISCNNLFLMTNKQKSYVLDILKQQFNQFMKILKIKRYDNILICGLGNDDITADSFGVKTCKKILSTRLLQSDIISSNICTISPNVQAMTGIETFDIVSALVKELDIKLVILIDSLITKNIKRLGHCFQFSTSGIIPGGAVIENKLISYETLNVKCLTIGVPFMIDLMDISKDIHKSIIVSSKDIRYMVEFCAELLANAINISLNKDITLDEIKELVNSF